MMPTLMLPSGPGNARTRGTLPCLAVLTYACAVNQDYINMSGFETEEPERLGGPELRRFFEGGLAALRSCAKAVDGLNVFPVPDGDTGTNMVATLAGALRNCPEGNLGTVAGALARGALLEARGNSGVILAQILAGLSSAFSGAT